MMSVSLGPVALPLLPLLLLAGIALAAYLAGRRARGVGGSGHMAADSAAGADPALPAAAEGAVWAAAVLGLLAARAGYVAHHFDAYGSAPLSVLDVRDGGWWSPAGWAVGGAWLLRCAWRRPALRQALARAALVLALLALALLAREGLKQAARMPATPLVALTDALPVTLHQAAAGRPAVVNLWATWCAPCRAEMPMLAAAQQAEAEVAFVFVNQGEAAQTVQRFLAREALPLQQVLLDPASALGPAVGSRGLPTTLFYDAQGQLVDAHFGLLNAAALQSRLRQLRPSP